MKILGKILLLLLCMGVLCLSASATQADSAQVNATVAADGSAAVELQLTVRLESDQKLSFLLPGAARNVRLNGSYKTPTAQNGQLILTTGTLTAGTQTLTLSYELDCLSADGQKLTLELPLLSGWDYPISYLSFSVTLPASLTAQPSFSSGYYGAQILEKMSVSVWGNRITGSVSGLLGKETLTLTYVGDSAMFPDYSADSALPGGWETVTIGLMVCSVLYYLIALTPRFPKKIRTYSLPEGFMAGDVGTCLTGCGLNLTMSVFSWAQMGYLSIEVDGRGRVWLHRRMDMGPERPEFEIRCFHKLFSAADSVDGTGMHYALLYRKVAQRSGLLRVLYASRSGNPRIVRGLALAAGACSGVLLSRKIYTAGAGTVLLALALALACGLLSHRIMAACRNIPLGNKRSAWMGALCAMAWIACGVAVGGAGLALGTVCYVLLMGMAAAVGGRHSETGRQFAAQVRGIRAHLTRSSIFDLKTCQQKNPSYFFDWMPYALALGVQGNFARRFGRLRLEQCDYFTAPNAENLTCAQWAAQMRRAADALDRRQRRMKYENLLPPRR